jgi:hypothetical protein
VNPHMEVQITEEMMHAADSIENADHMLRNLTDSFPVDSDTRVMINDVCGKLAPMRTRLRKFIATRNDGDDGRCPDHLRVPSES